MRSAKRPPNYQETVKGKEFLRFLKAHGVLSEESDLDSLSKLDSGSNSKDVKSRLDWGVKVLISNSKKASRVADREQLADLLITQAAFFMSAKIDRAEELAVKITEFRKEEERKPKGAPIEAENMEIDFYDHGWVDDLKPVQESSSSMMGIEKTVLPMACGMPEARPCAPQERPFKVTPLAKHDSNVINVGEAAGTSDDSLPKKIAQLERALTYVARRANTSNIEEVVGYAALCMSVVGGSSLGSVIINLHPEIFPYLAKLQKKGGLAYLFSRRTVYGDIDMLIEHYTGAEQRLRRMERLLIAGGVALIGVAVLAVGRKR